MLVRIGLLFLTISSFLNPHSSYAADESRVEKVFLDSLEGKLQRYGVNLGDDSSKSERRKSVLSLIREARQQAQREKRHRTYPVKINDPQNRTARVLIDERNEPLIIFPVSIGDGATKEIFLAAYLNGIDSGSPNPWAAAAITPKIKRQKKVKKVHKRPEPKVDLRERPEFLIQNKRAEDYRINKIYSLSEIPRKSRKLKKPQKPEKNEESDEEPGEQKESEEKPREPVKSREFRQPLSISIQDLYQEGSLRDAINRGRFAGGKDEKSLLTYFGQLTDSLRMMHEKRTVHCDIKPDNIIIDEDTAKFTDFEHAHIIDEAENDKFVTLGTPFYFGPETSLVGRPGRTLLSDSASAGFGTADIFQLGLTLSEARGQLKFDPKKPGREFKPESETLANAFEKALASTLSPEIFDRPSAETFGNQIDLRLTQHLLKEHFDRSNRNKWPATHRTERDGELDEPLSNLTREGFRGLNPEIPYFYRIYSGGELEISKTSFAEEDGNPILSGAFLVSGDAEHPKVTYSLKGERRPHSKKFMDELFRRRFNATADYENYAFIMEKPPLNSLEERRQRVKLHLRKRLNSKDATSTGN